MPRIILVDAHTAYRQALAFVLAQDSGYTIVGQSRTLAEAGELLSNADIAIIERTLPDGSGLDLIPQLQRANPAAVALVLTSGTDRRALARAVEAGAAGMLDKAATIEEILQAIAHLAAGEALISSLETVELLRFSVRLREEERETNRTLSRITPRERQVLQAMAEGLDDEGVAQALHMSTRTARTHVANIVGKLGVESRLQALVFAVRCGVARIG